MKQGMTRLLLMIMFISLMFFSLAAYSESSTWDCPECGRTGNTGNYCGGCAHPAPWLNTSTESPSPASELVDSGTWGNNLEWMLDKQGVLTVSGSGNMDDFDGSSTNAWLKHQGDITSLVVQDGVTSVGSDAFFRCTNLISVSFPNSLKTIRKHSFFGCTNLESITIPDSLITIEEVPFSECSKLTTIIVSDNHPYYSVVDDVLFNKEKTVICIFPEGKKDSQYSIPNSVKTIQNGAFTNCVNLQSINIPDSVDAIGMYAFEGCTNLKSIVFPRNIQILEYCVLHGCSKLSSVVLPEKLKTISTLAFCWCENLAEIDIPEGITTIQYGAFDSCKKLSKLSLPKSVSRIDENAFNGCYSLKTIDYTGTKENQKEINIVSAGNSALINAIWNYRSINP